jgi:hypothetical protein
MFNHLFVDTIWIISRSVRLTIKKIYQTKIVQNLETHILCSIAFCFVNLTVYELMWRNIVERGRPQIALWYMRFACWITKAVNTHTICIIIVAFTLQKSLHDRASILRYTYIGCADKS